LDRAGVGMHELPVTERILDIVLKHASGRRIRKIVRIHLTIGGLSDLENEWIQRYFDYLSRGTLAENAELAIRRAPIVLRCPACAGNFEIRRDQLGEARCPTCAEARVELIAGREYLVENMEVT
jgi:hydrogenase nickel incorporation protein HypA/HybF